MLQWHAEGQTPYIPFQEHTEHGDRAVLAAQTGHLSEHEKNRVLHDNVAELYGLDAVALAASA